MFHVKRCRGCFLRFNDLAEWALPFHVKQKWRRAVCDVSRETKRALLWLLFHVKQNGVLLWLLFHVKQKVCSSDLAVSRETV